MVGIDLGSMPTVTITRAQIGPPYVPIGGSFAWHPLEARRPLPVSGPTPVITSLVDTEGVKGLFMVGEVRVRFMTAVVLVTV